MKRALIALALLAGLAIPTSGIPALAAESESVGLSPRIHLSNFPHPTIMTEFSDSWGSPRPGGRRHQATDILSPKGTPVVAVADGIVITRKWHSASGYYLKIRHADGVVSAYVHLDNDTPGTDDGKGGEAAAFAEGIEVGSYVEAGQVIAFVGDSGNAEGTVSHTHFALELDGEKINPYPYLVDAWARQIAAFEAAGRIR